MQSPITKTFLVSVWCQVSSCVVMCAAAGVMSRRMTQDLDFGQH